MESRPFSNHFRPGRTFFFTEVDFRDRAKMDPFEFDLLAKNWIDTIHMQVERKAHI